MVITVTDDRRTIVGVTGGTVVDYTQLQRLLTEKAKSCPAGDVVCREVAGSGASMVWLTSFPDFSAFFRILFGNKPATACCVFRGLLGCQQPVGPGRIPSAA